MAKDKDAQTAMPTYKPKSNASVCLYGEHASDFIGAKVGSTIEVRVTGKLTSVSARQYKDEPGSTDLSIEVSGFEQLTPSSGPSLSDLVAKRQNRK